jgi:hypothetical protein
MKRLLTILSCQDRETRSFKDASKHITKHRLIFGEENRLFRNVGIGG